jgi:uncharacterized protein involved in exopolysaccharide biosynthesis
LAAQFGVAVPGTDRAQTPDFYAALVSSRVILDSVAFEPYDFNVDGRPFHGDLIELNRIAGSTEADRQYAALRDLQAAISINVGVKTGIVSFTVRARWAPLAALMADRILKRVADFNLHSKQTQAAAEREFTEARLAAVHGELSAAESDLAGFEMQNRNTQSYTPLLKLERDRLERAVTLRQQVYTSLAQMYEQARIDAVRNTPVVTIVDPPSIPLRPDSRLLVVKVLIGLMLGASAGVGVAYRLATR